MQPTPDVTRVDVERIIRRDFPTAAFAEILAILDTYGDKSYHREGDRVRLAALKVANGDVDALHRAIELARDDYRYVITDAEYLRYATSDIHSPEEEQRIIDEDWKEYQDWFSR